MLEEALGCLCAEPDVFDGTGIPYPRRMGNACHIALRLERPMRSEPSDRVPRAPARGASRPLADRGEIIAAVRARTGKRPIYVSPGHLTDIPIAVTPVLACAPRLRLPEPIRLAHRAAGQFEALRSCPRAP